MAHTVYSRAFALNGYVRLNGAASDWDRRRRRRRHRRLPRAMPAGRGGAERRCRRWRGEREGHPPVPVSARPPVCACGRAACARATRRRRRMRSHRKHTGQRVRPVRRRRPNRGRRGLNEYATKTAPPVDIIVYSSRNPICPPSRPARRTARKIRGGDGGRARRFTDSRLQYRAPGTQFMGRRIGLDPRRRAIWTEN